MRGLRALIVRVQRALTRASHHLRSVAFVALLMALVLGAVAGGLFSVAVFSADTCVNPLSLVQVRGVGWGEAMPLW